MSTKDIYHSKLKSVLHINYGFPWVTVIVKELRSLGWRADSLSLFRGYFDVKHDYYIEDPTRIRRFIGKRDRIKGLVFLPLISIDVAMKFFLFAVTFSWRYDVIHFHYHSALPHALRYVDLPLWRMLGRKVIIQFEGSDLRGHHHILPRVFSNAIIVTTPDLLKWERKASYIPGAIDLKELPYVGLKSHVGPIRIVHAPTNRAIKGTNYIINAVQELQSQGYAIELDLVENVSYQEAIERYKKADIVIDQVLIGWYGLVAIEAMALGKPVMVHIREDLRHYITGAPMLFTSPKTLANDLIVLIQDAGLRQKLSQRGRDYVERVHDAAQIAKGLVEIYV